jgi:hypothetical protein
MPAEAKHTFLADIRKAQAATRSGVATQYNARRNTAWDVWSSFCCSLCQDPTLHDIPNPVHLLQVFAARMRCDGQIAIEASIQIVSIRMPI